jgi:uncharacterized OsmC-like protein
VTIRSKRFEFAASVDRAGTMRAEGESPLRTPEGWSSDHLVLAALARCSLGSLRHHARRAGVAVEGAGQAQGTVAKRADDGRYALVDVTITLDVELEPALSGDALRELLAKAERDCFVGASLRAVPRCEWTVNGARLGGGA